MPIRLFLFMFFMTAFVLHNISINVKFTDPWKASPLVILVDSIRCKADFFFLNHCCIRELRNLEQNRTAEYLGQSLYSERLRFLATLWKYGVQIGLIMRSMICCISSFALFHILKNYVKLYCKLWTVVWGSMQPFDSKLFLLVSVMLHAWTMFGVNRSKGFWRYYCVT